MVCIKAPSTPKNEAKSKKGTAWPKLCVVSFLHLFAIALVISFWTFPNPLVTRNPNNLLVMLEYRGQGHLRLSVWPLTRKAYAFSRGPMASGSMKFQPPPPTPPPNREMVVLAMDSNFIPVICGQTCHEHGAGFLAYPTHRAGPTLQPVVVVSVCWHFEARGLPASVSWHERRVSHRDANTGKSRGRNGGFGVGGPQSTTKAQATPTFA